MFAPPKPFSEVKGICTETEVAAVAVAVVVGRCVSSPLFPDEQDAASMARIAAVAAKVSFLFFIAETPVMCRMNSECVDLIYLGAALLQWPELPSEAYGLLS